jgi:hypothetical protein
MNTPANSTRPTGKFYVRQGHRTGNPKDPLQKAASDLFGILEAAGYRSLNSLSLPGRLGKLADIALRLLNIVLRVRRGCVVVFNLPANYRFMQAVHLLKRLIGFKLVVHCYDMESLRYSTPMQLSPRERQTMNGCDVVLTPSANSEAILRPLGVTAACIPVQVWDYLHPQDVTCPQGDGRVAFAGNPRKAAFLSELGELRTAFTVWAQDYQTPHPNVQALGVAALPENLAQLARSGWGLVWDGESIDGERLGPLGQYTRVMTTHKGGLYLAAGLPLIVWSQGGMAPFVRDNRIGICVDSLRELDHILPALSAEDCAQFRRNAGELAGRIRTGYFLTQALRRAEALLRS